MFPPMLPAASYTRLHMSATVSSSSSVMLNLARSGLNVMQVQLSFGLHLVTTGALFSDMLFRNTWRYRRSRDPSHVSMTNSELKMLASFAPYPLRPPVTFFSPSS